MGQAKQRGTFEQRKANPNPKPEPRKWTPEERQMFLDSMKETLDTIKKQLFGPSKPKKAKPRRIKTGG